ncbi:LysR substrate-binding domain-containing protein [Aliamphritea hakodatensis]|uniref:LysR substrate-binding domain-containing protein n=1 Tax=Aliamphritea hakodatensis TaxID=2895352 RepID=UPI0022FD7913|nr:LysR substrate-binding domain-containing protein [Aliamphritea hakodatensis]
MRRHLPPLNAIKAFEAVARQQSFTAAAAELCVSQSAVSKQVARLEAHLQLQLVERHAKGIRLSKEGEAYLQVLTDALDAIDQASARLSNVPHQLRIDTLPSLSSIWLIPRLTDFQQRHPGIEVELITGDGPVDFTASEADLAIRCFADTPTGNHSQLLIRERLHLVASPALVESRPVNHLSDLRQFTLLRQTTRPDLWQQFFRHWHDDEQAYTYGFASQHFFMTLQSVKEGIGIALLPDFLVAEQLESGQLCAPLNLSLDSGYGYYLQIPVHKRQQLQVRQFSHWLQTQLPAAE